MSAPLQEFDLDYSTPASVWFERIRVFGHGIWLDSCYPQSAYGRYDILSAGPNKTYRFTNNHLHVFDTKLEQEHHIETASPFKHLTQDLPTSDKTKLPFVGGYLGYFGYDIGRALEELPAIAPSLVNLPDMILGLYAWAIVIDHKAKSTQLVINPLLCDAQQAHRVKNHLLLTKLNSADTCSNEFNIAPFTPLTTKQNYVESINKIQAYIQAGDCYQVNLAQAFQAEFKGDCFDAYLRLRNKLPSPFSCYMEFPEGSILSLSPERFIQLANGLAETKPIKGTIQRGATSQEDEALALQLTNSPKDRAENVMIVDLLRNDLSKTCSDVKVPALCELQSFPNVHHLVSTITGKLREGNSALDLLEQAFPGGSITGAPKIRAMEIIEELEPLRRSVYCGSLGYISACGNMDTNIAIRTLVSDNKHLYCWGGGGIVADSIPEQEYNETLTKISVLLNTLEREFLKTTHHP